MQYKNCYCKMNVFIYLCIFTSLLYSPSFASQGHQQQVSLFGSSKRSKLLEFIFPYPKRYTSLLEGTINSTVPIVDIKHFDITDYPVYNLLLPGNSEVQLKIKNFDKNVSFIVLFSKDYPDEVQLCNEKVIFIESSSIGNKKIIKQILKTEAVQENLRDPVYSEYHIVILPYKPNEGQNDLNFENSSFSFYVSRKICSEEDENNLVWSQEDCPKGLSSREDPKPLLGTEFILPVILEPNDYTLNEEKVRANPLIPTTVTCLVAVYLFLIIVCYILDSRDRIQQKGITIMAKHGEEGLDYYFYIITAFTGVWTGAGTTANVCIQIYGSNGRSTPYVLKDKTINVLARGGTDSFLISSEKDLGELEKIMIWHDNSGITPKWHCKKITIKDVQREKVWNFLVNKWLSAAEGSLYIKVPVAKEAQREGWKRRFMNELSNELSNHHLWFSAFVRPPGSAFTRVQRISCAFVVLTSYMLINLMFYGIQPKDKRNLIEIGDTKMSIGELVLSLETSLFTAPFGIFIVFLFRRIRQRYITTVVIWKIAYSKKDKVISEDHIFLDSKNHPLTIKRIKGDPEDYEKFKIPETNMENLEKWITDETVKPGLDGIRVPYKYPEPDEFVHLSEKKDREVEKDYMVHLGRSAIIQAVKREKRESFYFDPDMDNEKMEAAIEEEVKENQKKNILKNKWNQSEIVKFDLERKPTDLRKYRVLKTVPKLKTESGRNDRFTFSNMKVFFQLYLMPPLQKKTCYLPWWTSFFVWIFCIALIGTLSFFTFIYGLRLNQAESLRWIQSIVLNIIISIIVIQPAKSIVVSLVYATFFINNSDGPEYRFQVVVHNYGEEIGKHKPLAMNIFHPIDTFPPITGQAAYSAKIEAKKMRKVRHNFVLLVIYIFLIFLMAFVVHVHFNKKSIWAVSSMESLFGMRNAKNKHNFKIPFTSIKNEKTFWDFMEQTFVPAMYMERDYTGNLILTDMADLYISDYNSALIGIPRLRQSRVKNDLCRNSKHRQYFSFCTPNFEIKTQDTHFYSPKWKEYNGENFNENMTTEHCWSWKSRKRTQALPFIGTFALYDGGGYVANLGENGEDTGNILKELRENEWFDMRTRVLFIEFSTYIPNVHLYMDVQMVVERGPSRGLELYSQVKPLVLPRNLTSFIAKQSSSEDYFDYIFLAYVAIALFTFILVNIWLITFVQESIDLKWKIFRQFWLWFDFLNIFFIIIAIGMSLERSKVILDFQISLSDNIQAYDGFYSLQKAALWDQLQTNFFAIAICLCMIRSFKLEVFVNERLHYMLLALRISSKYIMAFIFMILIALISFASFGHIVFGKLDSFKTFVFAIRAIIPMQKPLFTFHTLYDENRVMGPVFYFIYGFIVVLVGVNVIIALMNEGMDEAKKISSQQKFFSYLTPIKNMLFKNRFKFPRFGGFFRRGEEKTDIRPERFIDMKDATATFIRECLETKEIRRMQEIKNYCNREILKDTEFKMVSKIEKKRQVRQKVSRNIPEERIKEMADVTIAYLRKKLRIDFTHEEAMVYQKFNDELSKIKVKKIDEKMARAEEKLQRVLGQIEEKEAATTARLQKEQEFLKRSGRTSK